ncbi:alcohol dehydrogenase [Reticulibacter mediterranei]|uniref:Alcohol dehydrogenase n=1 Tax=Reticulibacter mediterranei TaxID=2778369 RepID=A0A8J3IYL5_9CHLR|nr:alcohol dehydrogenase catalytic domain-containing protein [Reticulibacter mediterranei]GHP00881.1 alcohol dehydrogenase [Reticulibacter mediterranei]
MKAALVYGANDLRLQEVAKPGPPKAGEVLLHVSLVGLCGTDAQHVAHPSRPPRRPGPIILGHEIVGQVVAVGEGVTAPRLGERVVPGAGWWCGHCDACLSGRTNICDEYFLYGIQDHGGLAEYACFPAKMCVVVPSTCPDEVAVLGQPLAIALHAISRAALTGNETIAIFGVGGIGSLILAVLAGRGHHRILAVDLEDSKLAWAEHCGALAVHARQRSAHDMIEMMTGGQGVALAIDAAGTATSIPQALASVRKGGTLLLVGIPKGPVLLPLGSAIVSEKNIITTNGHCCQHDLPAALALLASSDLASRLVVETIPFTALKERGLGRLLSQQAAGKIIVSLQEERSSE